MEHVVSWIAGADEAAMLAAFYAPTHESAAVILLANAACRARAGQLLNALCDVLRDPANANTPLFTRSPADSTAATHVFQFVPPP